MNSKEYFFNEVIREAVAKIDGPIRVLEPGCGKATYMPVMIEKYPQLKYVGIEPIEDSFLGQRKILREYLVQRFLRSLGTIPLKVLMMSRLM